MPRKNTEVNENETETESESESEFNLDTSVDEIPGDDKVPFSVMDTNDSDLDIALNQDKYEELRRKVNPPGGDWVKTDEFEVVKFRREGDCQRGDINPEGRTTWVFSGYCTPKIDVDNNEHNPLFKFYASPDERYHPDKPGQLDGSTKNWLKAMELYLAKNGSKSTSPRQIIEFLTQESYTLRTMVGDDGLFVLGIKPNRRS